MCAMVCSMILWKKVARRLKKTKVEELTLCATLMRRGGQYAHALETYTKLGDFRSAYIHNYHCCWLFICKADIIVFGDIELVIKVFYMADPFSLSMLSSISGRRHFL